MWFHRLIPGLHLMRLVNTPVTYAKLSHLQTYKSCYCVAILRVS